MHSEDAHASPEAAPDEWAGCVPPGYAVDCSPTMMTGVKCEPAWVRACLAAQSDGWRFCHNEAYCDRGELLFNMSPELYRIAHGPAAGREVKRGDGEWVVPAKCSGWELWWEGRWCALGHLNVNGINKTQTSMPGAYYRLPEVSEAPAPDLEGALSRGMSNALKQPAAPDASPYPEYTCTGSCGNSLPVPDAVGMTPSEKMTVGITPPEKVATTYQPAPDEFKPDWDVVAALNEAIKERDEYIADLLKQPAAPDVVYKTGRMFPDELEVVCAYCSSNWVETLFVDWEAAGYTVTITKGGHHEG